MINYFLMPHPPIALPQIGKGEEKKIQNTIDAFNRAFTEIESFNPQTLIIISPHGTLFRDAFSIYAEPFITGDFKKFNVNDLFFKYEIDLDLTFKIIDKCRENNLPIVPLTTNISEEYNIPLTLDHGSMVPLYFYKNTNNAKLIHITYSLLSKFDHIKFGNFIKEVISETNKNTVVIASGDLSHCLTLDGLYPYSPSGTLFDNTLIENLKSGDLETALNIHGKLLSEASECGMRSLYILGGILGTKTIQSELYSYEGPFGVGYAVMKFSEGSGDLLGSIKENLNTLHIKKLNNPQTPYTSLARRALDYYFKSKKILDLDSIDTSSIPNIKKGVFVSIYTNGNLRGCVGTTSPTTSCIANEIATNSLSAAFKDPRFSPLTYSELLESTISIYLLNESEKTTFEKLDPKVYGVIVKANGKTGLLLPNLEGITTSLEQVHIAKAKGGIVDDDGEIALERFTVERFEE
ncbi:AmmeMemoRadiSam system protein A [uncultured Clostridium sp.]|uniref:AmmeMemoRadiSam system protein A n=1 Tax=uncultured Clostridium sp. TaxID=59620 RepID=UPI00261CE208|nr:AmmeMemoRadiSam system protein A [uncultured Clostridium sp.]